MRDVTRLGRPGRLGRGLLGGLIALSLVACDRGAPEAPRPGPGAGEAQRALAGWMGAFGRRDPAVATLLGGVGWMPLRDMDLEEAGAAFAGDPEPGPRVALARVYLYLADLAEALDGAFLDAEAQYLRAAEGEAGRRAVVAWRRGSLEEARAAAAGSGSQGSALAVVRAALAVPPGRSWVGPNPATAEEAEFAVGIGYLVGLTGVPGSPGPIGQAVAALEREEPGRALAALAKLDLTRLGSGTGPELVYYPLVRRAYGALAARALRVPEGPAAAFLAANAAEHRGDRARAAELYAATEDGGDPLEAFVFSPFLDAADLAEVGAVRRAGTLGQDPGEKGRVGDLARAEAVRIRAELGLGAAVGEPVRGIAPGAFGDGEEGAAVAALYGARAAAVARSLARAHWARKQDDQALDVLEVARRRGAGARPDFRNPPAFLADLGRGYARTGAYAPAVGVLFDLSARFRPATLCYESLKRLYAFRSGGEVPPR